MGASVGCDLFRAFYGYGRRSYVWFAVPIHDEKILRVGAQGRDDDAGEVACKKISVVVARDGRCPNTIFDAAVELEGRRHPRIAEIGGAVEPNVVGAIASIDPYDEDLTEVVDAHLGVAAVGIAVASAAV